MRCDCHLSGRYRGEPLRTAAAGLDRLAPGNGQLYAPPADGVRALDAHWPTLDGLSERNKAALIEAIVAVVSHDRVMTVAETELVRTICALLHCPLPPLVPTA